jgi:hypothetical protein
VKEGTDSGTGAGEVEGEQGRTVRLLVHPLSTRRLHAGLELHHYGRAAARATGGVRVPWSIALSLSLPPTATAPSPSAFICICSAPLPVLSRVPLFLLCTLCGLFSLTCRLFGRHFVVVHRCSRCELTKECRSNRRAAHTTTGMLRPRRR